MQPQIHTNNTTPYTKLNTHTEHNTHTHTDHNTNTHYKPQCTHTQPQCTHTHACNHKYTQTMPHLTQSLTHPHTYRPQHQNTHTTIYTHTHTHTTTHTNTDHNVYTHTHMYACTCTHTHTHACTHTKARTPHHTAKHTHKQVLYPPMYCFSSACAPWGWRPQRSTWSRGSLSHWGGRAPDAGSPSGTAASVSPSPGPSGPSASIHSMSGTSIAHF